MAIDYGDARIGLAVSDEAAILVGDAWTLSERNAARAADAIISEAQKRGVGQFVLGYPRNMDGSAGLRCEKSERFKALIEERCAIPVILWDEPAVRSGARHPSRLRQKVRPPKMWTGRRLPDLESYSDT
jgi:putative Holliday junction resolvase